MCILCVTDVRIFVETFDAKNEEEEEAKIAEAVVAASAATESFPRTATVSADSFVSRAVADPMIVQFLGMRPSTAGGDDASGSGSSSSSSSSAVNNSHLTLREALRELIRGASGGGAKRARPESRELCLRWEDIEALLFKPYDPTEMFSNPPSTVPIGSAPVGPRGAQHQEEEVGAHLDPVGLLGELDENPSLSLVLLARLSRSPQRKNLFRCVDAESRDAFFSSNIIPKVLNPLFVFIKHMTLLPVDFLLAFSLEPGAGAKRFQSRYIAAHDELARVL